MQAELSYNPKLETVKRIIEELGIPQMVEVTNGDQIMGDQLKRMLSNKPIEDINTDDLIEVGMVNEQFAEWLSEKQPAVIAHAIRLSYATNMPPDE